MIPITPEQLREHVEGWPVGDLQKAIRAALPDLNAGVENLIAHWLLVHVTDPRSAL